MTETIEQLASDNNKITPTQARALLEQEIVERQEACTAEINAVLRKHNCQIVVVRGFTEDGRLVTRPEVRAAG